MGSRRGISRGASIDIKADVFRMTLTTGKGWKRHDHRSLLLAGSKLIIYEKGSLEQVKNVIQVQEGVLECNMVNTVIMQMKVRVPRSSSLTRFRAGSRDKMAEKVYIFEFSDSNTADTFHTEITRLRYS